MIRGSWYLFVFVALFSLLGLSRVAVATSDVGIPITNPYDVHGVEVDVTADNAVKAREQAFAKALSQAFTQIMIQLEPDPAKRVGWTVPDTAVLGPMLQDFKTANEKMSTTQYSAVFDMRFKPGRVQRYLQMATDGPTPNPQPQTIAQGQGNVVPQTTSAATTFKPVLVLPFYQQNDRLVLWSGTNPLRDALGHEANASALAKLPMGDLDDIQIFSDAQGLKFNAAQFVTLLHKYGVEQALVVVAVPDTYRAMQNNAGTVAPTKLTLMNYFASVRSPAPAYVDSSWVSFDELKPSDDLFQKAARAVYAQVPNMVVRFAALEPAEQIPMVSGVPTTSAVSVTPVDPLTQDIIPGAVQYAPMQVQFKTLTEWQNIRSRLGAVKSISQVRVKRLRAQEAQIEIVYKTSIDHVLRDISMNGVQVMHAPTPRHVVTGGVIDMEPAAGDTPMYVLALPQAAPGFQNESGSIPLHQAM